MTTLPQTTSPVQNTPVRPSQIPLASSGVAYNAASANVTAFQMTGADVWRVIRANLWLIVLFLIVFGIGGYALNYWWVRNHPRYTSQGLLELQKRQVLDFVTDKAIDMADTQVMIELRTESQKLTNPALFSSVLKKNDGDLINTSWYKQFITPGGTTINASEAKAYLQDYFRAAPVPDTNLLNVSFSWRVPQDCKVVVDAIVKEYLEQQTKIARDRNTVATKALDDMVQDLSRRIRDRGESIRLKQADLAKRGMGMIGTTSPKLIELTGLIEAQMKLSSNYSEAQNMYIRIKDQIDQQGGTASEVERAVENDITLSGLLRDQTNYEIRRDTTAARLGKEHRDVIEMNNMLEAVKQKIDERRAELRAKFGAQYIRSLEGAAKQSKLDFDAITKNVEALKADLGDLGTVAALLMNEQQDEKNLREELQRVSEKQRIMQSTNDTIAQPRVRWAASPEVPDLPSFPKLKLILPASVMLGLALALGIAFLREFLNDTIRSPRDVSRVGQLNLLGIIADEADDPQVADAKLAIFDAPHSMTAEQFRQVRTRLQFGISLETTRTIMVAGPSPMDGATTVAANLAAGLALNGKRVLLVDANFRRPELHRLFGLANERGFSDALGGAVASTELIHASRIPNLSVLSSGPKPSNATELFESQLLSDFIDRHLEDFDHIVFDSAPFLLGSEAPAMAARVDGVVTVVRAHAGSRGVLLRMREMLRQLKAENLGVVLNAVRAQGGGYYRRNIKAFYTYNNEA